MTSEKQNENIPVQFIMAGMLIFDNFLMKRIGGFL